MIFLTFGWTLGNRTPVNWEEAKRRWILGNKSSYKLGRSERSRKKAVGEVKISVDGLTTTTKIATNILFSISKELQKLFWVNSDHVLYNMSFLLFVV